MKNQLAIVLILTAVIISSISVWLYEQSSIEANYEDGGSYNPINVSATAVHFNSTELQNFENIKNRLNITNTDPNFTGNRALQWISMRNSSSATWDPYQKSMEYLCFWSGQGANGEWETV